MISAAIAKSASASREGALLGVEHPHPPLSLLDAPPSFDPPSLCVAPSLPASAIVPVSDVVASDPPPSPGDASTLASPGGALASPGGALASPGGATAPLS
jgi:hypothetical protein